MRKSKYGKETTFLWEGSKNVQDIKLVEVSSTLQISDDMKDKIKAEWKKIVKNNPNVWDSPKWRTEFVFDEPEKLNIYVSPIFYSEHNVMRHLQNLPMQSYPNPLTINALQVTADGYILLGVKGKGSDQSGLGIVGGGFVERYLDNKGYSKKPESLGFVVQRECLQETKYNQKKDFYMEDAKALGVVFGSNHDTTVVFHLPIFATSKQVSINNNEHDDLLLLPAKTKEIQDVLNAGSYQGIKASDHLLGCLELYMNTLRK